MSNRVPQNLIAAWRRESLSIQEMEPSEDSQVIWLQSPTRYADVRIPLPGIDTQSESFAGRQEWHDPRLTFHHELDLSGRFPDDSGILSWRDHDTLIEDGSAELDGRKIRYQELWQRLTPTAPDYQAFEARDETDTLLAIAIRIGEHAAVISSNGAFSASYMRWKDRRWLLQWGIGAAPGFQFPAEIDPGNSIAVAGLEWRCVEATP